MTSDEIKQMYSMREIISRYGFEPNRSGFINCPFHDGDRDASMKIYEKDYNCFGCGENGDIFDFVQKMETVGFREAFKILGGEYEHSFAGYMRIEKAKKEKENKLKQEKRLKDKIALNNLLIDTYRKWLSKSLPLSQAWTDCYNALQYQLYRHEELEERRCQLGLK